MLYPSYYLAMAPFRIVSHPPSFPQSPHHVSQQPTMTTLLIGQTNDDDGMKKSAVCWIDGDIFVPMMLLKKDDFDGDYDGMNGL